jgi:hypothetical protein
MRDKISFSSEGRGSREEPGPFFSPPHGERRQTDPFSEKKDKGEPCPAESSLSRSNCHSSRVLTLFARGFLLTVAVILGITALGKLAGVAADVPVLSEPDSLLAFLTNRQIILLAAVLELAVLACFFSKRLDITIKLLSVAWISTVFLIYRLGLWSVGYSGSCSCLGLISEALGLSPAKIDLGMRIMLYYLVGGSYSICALLLRNRIQETAASGKS